MANIYILFNGGVNTLIMITLTANELLPEYRNLIPLFDFESHIIPSDSEQFIGMARELEYLQFQSSTRQNFKTMLPYIPGFQHYLLPLHHQIHNVVASLVIIQYLTRSQSLITRIVISDMYKGSITILSLLQSQVQLR